MDERKKKNEYRVNKIKFENYKGYLNQQIFDFETKRRFQNDNSTEIVQFKNQKAIKYKKIIGIYGKNSSGKSSLFEIIALWCSIFQRLNGKIKTMKFESFFKEPREILIGKYSSPFYSGNLNIEDIKEYSYFNNSNKPLIIELAFNTTNFNFSYIVNETFSKNKSESSYREIIFLNDENNENSEKIWDSHETNISLINFLKISEEIFHTNQSIKKVENFSKINESFLNTLTNFKKYIDLNFSNEKISILEDIKKIISSFIRNISFIEPGSNTSNTTAFFIRDGLKLNFVENINYELNEIKKTNLSTEKIRKILLSLIKVLDSNIKDIELVEGKKKKDLIFKSIINKNNVKNFPEELSLGTLNYLKLILQIIRNKFNEKNDQEPKYIFIDELGLNWHPNLTMEFIEGMTKGLMGKNTFLVFTTHEVNIGNNLNTDSIYVIDNETNLKKVTDLTNLKGLKPRKKVKFSEIYLDDTIDFYSTSPDFTHLEELEELINELSSKKK